MPKLCDSTSDLRVIVQSMENKIGLHGEARELLGKHSDIVSVDYRFSVNYCVDRKDLDLEKPIEFDRKLRRARIQALRNCVYMIQQQLHKQEQIAGD